LNSYGGTSAWYILLWREMTRKKLKISQMNEHKIFDPLVRKVVGIIANAVNPKQ